MEDKIEFYNEKEIEEILKKGGQLYYADDGMNEVVIKEEDIPDFIIKVNKMEGYNVDIKMYRVNGFSMNPVLTTFGPFLNKIEKELREKVIDRLVALQKGEKELKDFKVIDEDDLEIISEKVTEMELEKEYDFSISDKDNENPVGMLLYHLSSNYTDKIEFYNEKEMLNKYKEQLNIAGPEGIDYEVYSNEEEKRDGLSYELRKAYIEEFGDTYSKIDYLDEKKEKEKNNCNKEAR